MGVTPRAENGVLTISGTDIFTPSEVEQERAAPKEGIVGPNLLDMDEKKAVQEMMTAWDASHRVVRPLIEMWKVNVARSDGYTGVRLNKVQDEARAYIPWTATPNLSAMNQARRLKNRVRALLFADEPMLEGTPSSDEDEDKDAAEDATRVVQDISSEGNLSYAIRAAEAFDCGSDFGSGFVRFWVDPTGGGWRPKELQAAPVPEATAQDPLYQPGTKIPWMTQDGKVPDPIRRYVKSDGTLTDDKADPDVERQWLPKIRDEELDGRHVRFLPTMARDIWDADGCQVGAMVPLGVLKGVFPEIQKFPPEKLTKIVSSRPQNAQDLLPKGQREPDRGTITDATLVFTLTRYHRQSYTYPKGAYLCCVGDDTLLHREELWDEEHGEPLDIPITQFKQFNKKDNPYGVALMEHLGPGNELRAYLFGYILDHLERLANRKTFVPYTATYTAEQLQAPMATVLQITPNTEPKYEDVPAIPNDVTELFTAVKEDMNDESGLQQAAQGVEGPTVKSGIHAQAIIEQAMQSLSDLKQNTQRAYIRGGRIILQLVRARYTVPQRVKWVGDDGAYKDKEFTNADLSGCRDVRLSKGSFTQLAPSAKAALAEQMFNLRDPVTNESLLSLEELRSVVAGNVGGLLAIQDNPHLLRVRRQISQWRDGPPEEWQPPQAAVDPTGAPLVDPATGQSVPPPPDPLLAGIFAPVAADDEPMVAKLRAFELARAIASTRFSRWPTAWQDGITQEYLRMRHASGMQTVADQEQVAAQQQEQLAAEQQKMQQATDLQAAQKDQTAQQQQQLVAEIQQLEAEIKATQQALAQLGKAIEPAIKQAVTPIADAVQTVSGEVQKIAKAQDDGAQQLAKVGENVAEVLDETEDTLRDKLEAKGKELEEKVMRLAETLKPAPTNVQLPPSDAQTQALSTLGEAVESLAQRPTAFKVVRDTDGKMTGVVAVDAPTSKED